MNKQQRKAYRRIRIAAVIATQNRWIEDAFCVEATTRRERDRLFARARQMLGAAHQIVPQAAV